MQPETSVAKALQALASLSVAPTSLGVTAGNVSTVTGAADVGRGCQTVTPRAFKYASRV